MRRGERTNDFEIVGFVINYLLSSIPPLDAPKGSMRVQFSLGGPPCIAKKSKKEVDYTSRAIF
jgi:hypothetical protein